MIDRRINGIPTDSYCSRVRVLLNDCKKTVTAAEESDEEDDYEYIEFEDEEDGTCPEGYVLMHVDRRRKWIYRGSWATLLRSNV